MSAGLQIGLLGYGEVGQVLGSDLNRARMCFFDPKGVSACDERVTRAEDARALAAGSDLIISCVTAAQTIEAAQSTCAGLAPGAWFLDLNSASPGAKRAAAEMITNAGGRYVEASVMSPIAPKRLGTAILIGGPDARAFLDVGQDAGFSNLSVFAEDYGPTAAVKMCRSVLVKGIEALLSESLVTARTHGVEGAVIASLDDLFPGPDWRTLSRYMISRALEHGTRRAEEMREAARTVREAGLSPWMSAAIAERQDWAAEHAAALQTPDLEAMLDALVEATASDKAGARAP